MQGLSLAKPAVLRRPKAIKAPAPPLPASATPPPQEGGGTLRRMEGEGAGALIAFSRWPSNPHHLDRVGRVPPAVLISLSHSWGDGGEDNT